ncbi:MAG TPA: hypothetical protein V6C52_06750 [Coleofasciculaceae cyanobacterium]|jgi:hypothetical protein
MNIQNSSAWNAQSLPARKLTFGAKHNQRPVLHFAGKAPETLNETPEPKKFGFWSKFLLLGTLATTTTAGGLYYAAAKHKTETSVAISKSRESDFDRGNRAARAFCDNLFTSVSKNMPKEPGLDGERERFLCPLPLPADPYASPSQAASRPPAYLVYKFSTKESSESDR